MTEFLALPLWALVTVAVILWLFIGATISGIIAGSGFWDGSSDNDKGFYSVMACLLWPLFLIGVILMILFAITASTTQNFASWLKEINRR